MCPLALQHEPPLPRPVSRWWLTVAAAGALWPAWQWYARRLADGSDEPWGLLALAALLGWCVRQRKNCSPRFGWSAACLTAYTVSYGFVPPILRAAFGALALGALVLPREGRAGCWGLILLSLPVLASVQFYLSYPLRLTVAEGSALLLHLAGLQVQVRGAALLWQGQTVLVDVPCAGLHMLWFGLFLASASAAIFRLSARRSLCAGAAALVVVLAANVARATALFPKEAHLVPWPEWTHAGVGLGCFAWASWGIVTITRKLQPRP